MDNHDFLNLINHWGPKLHLVKHIQVYDLFAHKPIHVATPKD